MEYKLFDTDVAGVSTFAFHQNRDRAPHWDQAVHRPRMEKAVEFTRDAAARVRESSGREIVKIVDLGCGDGGVLAALDADVKLACVGYDFQPSNVVGWAERKVLHNTFALDFVEHWPIVIDADVYMITEVLEHLTDPHEMVRRIRAREAHIIASSPYTETAASHDECHAWAWDPDGYRQLVETAGFRVVDHTRVDMFQVIWGEPRG